MQIVDSVLSKPKTAFISTREQSASPKLISAINSLTTAIQNSSDLNFTYSGENIVLAAVKIKRSNFPLNFTSPAMTHSSENAFEFSTGIKDTSFAQKGAFVSLPEEILDFVPGEYQCT